MCQGDAVGDGRPERLHLSMTEPPMGRIPIMRNADMAREQFYIIDVEDFFGEPHAFFFVHAVIISHNACCVLSAVLQVDDAVVEFSCHRFMGINAGYTAH